MLLHKLSPARLFLTLGLCAGFAAIPCAAQGPPGQCTADVTYNVDPAGGPNGGPGQGSRVPGPLRIHYTVAGTNGTYDAEIWIYKSSAIVRPVNGSPYIIRFQPGETYGDYINALCSGNNAFNLSPNAPLSEAVRGPHTAAATAGASPIVGAEGVTTSSLPNGYTMIAWLTGSALNSAAGSATGAQNFNQYPTGPTPTYVIAADFNGDGIADLAVSNYGSTTDSTGGNIQIFLGKSDGSFTAGAKINVTTPGTLVSGDFNGDGKLDLMVANDNGASLFLLTGYGDGTFQTPATITFPVSACKQVSTCIPISLIAADFNGDGRLDIAMGLATGSAIQILPGNGNGTFQSGVTYSLEGSITYLAAADVTGDGKLDLVAAIPSANMIAVLPGKGDATFQTPSLFAAGASPQYFGLILASDGAIVLTLDNITGDMVITPLSFQTPAASEAYALSTSATSVTAGDLNGDGLPDIVAAAGTISVLVRNPSAQFLAPVNYKLQSGSTAVEAVVGDLNGDGKPDIAAAGSAIDNSGTLDILLGNGDGTLGKQSSIAIGGWPGGLSNLTPSGMVAADFNRDGKLDLAVGYQPSSSSATGGGGISLLLGNGDGTFHAPVNLSAGSNLATLALVTGDFNNDGKPDLIAGVGGAQYNYTTPGSLAIFLGKGDGTFQAPTTLPVGSPAGTPVAIAMGDLNHDGQMDLVVSVWNANLSATIVVLLGNGDGTFRQSTPFQPSAAGQTLALADLDGDGALDLIVGDCCGLSESVYLLGNGDGTFQAAQHFSSGSSIASMAVASWNNDGIAGLAFAQQTATVMAVESGLNPKFTGAPQIHSMENAANGVAVVAPNTWLEIDGAALAPTGDSRTWKGSDFIDGQMPTSLDGVEVTVNGVAAYVYFISPGQVDVLTPPGTLPSSTVQVVVISQGAVSKAFSAPTQTVSPAWFVYGGTSYLAATHANGALIGPTTLYPGYSTPAKPGETIALYANGFGATSQAVVSGSSTQGGTLSPLPTVTIGGAQATVTFAGLVSPGEFQLNVVVPSTLGNGDQVVVASYNGVSTQTNSSITVQQ